MNFMIPNRQLVNGSHGDLGAASREEVPRDKAFIGVRLPGQRQTYSHFRTNSFSRWPPQPGNSKTQLSVMKCSAVIYFRRYGI